MTLVNPPADAVESDPSQEELSVYPPAIQSFGDLPSVEEFFHSLVLMDEAGALVAEADGSYRIVIPNLDALTRFSNLTRDYATLLRSRENLTLLIQHLDQLAPFIMAQTDMESGAVIDFNKLGTFLAKCVFEALHRFNMETSSRLQEKTQESESAEVGEASVPTWPLGAGVESEEGAEALAENVVPFGAQS